VVLDTKKMLVPLTLNPLTDPRVTLQVVWNTESNWVSTSTFVWVKYREKYRVVQKKYYWGQ